MNPALLFAFTAGAVATVNPCGFAMLPVWFAKRMAEGQGAVSNLLRALGAGIAATFGFVLIFGIAGAILALGAAWFGPALAIIGFGVGIAVTLMGLAGLGGNLSGRLPGAGTCRRISDRQGNVVFGIGYGLLSLSCTLPIFLAALGVALTENPLGAAINLLAYAAGMGTVLTTLGLSAALGRAGFGTLSPRAHRVLKKFTAALVLLAGLYVTFYWGRVVFGDVMTENALVARGDRISSMLRGWLSGSLGRGLTLGVFLLLVTGAGVATLYRWRARCSQGRSTGQPRQRTAAK